MKNLYTTERWLRLCEVVAGLSGKTEHIDAMELRPLFAFKEDWEFAMKRLLALGLVFWLDLSPTERECAQATQIAAEKAKTPEALEAEINLLFAPLRCVAGRPLRVIPPFPTSDMTVFDFVREPTFGSQEGFVRGTEGPAFFLSPEENQASSH